MYTGRGHDRYAFKLINEVKKQFNNVNVWESKFEDTFGAGTVKTIFEGAVQEFIFPFKFYKEKADIFHATSALGGKTIALLNKRPLVSTILDVIHFSIKKGYDLPVRYFYKYWGIKLAALRSDMIITLFKSTKYSLVEKLKIPESRIRIVPIGINHEKFFPIHKEPNKTKRIIFLGEATFSKGVDTLIRAFAKVLDKLSDAELLIGSEGRDLLALKDLAKRLNVGKQVKFLGYIPESDLHSFYCKGDVFVFPSRYGFGLPILEAMACGIPTISVDTLDARDCVGDSGILIKSGNFNQLADSIYYVLTDQKASRELSSKGINKAKSLTWQNTAEKTIDVYRELI